MYTLYVRLSNSPGPYVVEGFVELPLWPASHYFIDECHVFARWKYERKLIVSGCKNVVDAIICAVDDLDIFHAI
ncbi:MAG: hypothetical protein AB3X41_11830 [Leptothrix ochracea]|uniref:hypothetical protein n=1 Tax=Leptothrix ochracea TaxID=735331 RepID=UPI0034E28786